MTSPAMAPPGWYPDQAGRHEYRYWDGTDWTAQVSDRGVTASDPLELRPATPTGASTVGAAPVPDGEAPAAQQTGPPPGRPVTTRPRSTGRILAWTFRILAWTFGILLALLGVSRFAAANNENEVSDNENNVSKKSFAADYKALGDRAADKEAQALNARVPKVKAAYDAYVNATDTVGTRHQAVTDQFNKVVSTFNSNNRLGASEARKKLPKVIADYRASLKQEQDARQTFIDQLALLKARVER